MTDTKYDLIEIGCVFSRLNEKHVEDTDKTHTIYTDYFGDRVHVCVNCAHIWTHIAYHINSVVLTFQSAAIVRQSRRLNSIVCRVHWYHCRQRWPIAVGAMVMVPAKLNYCSASPSESIRLIGESIWRDSDATQCCYLNYLQIDYGDARAYRCRSHRCLSHVQLVCAVSSHLVCSLCSTMNYCALDFVMSLRVATKSKKWKIRKLITRWIWRVQHVRTSIEIWCTVSWRCIRCTATAMNTTQWTIVYGTALNISLD